jgi:hypothetical protein
MYVSYRIGNDVFWTKHRLTLPKGETMLTDGRAMARTRCGNRVSALPSKPNALVEPTTEELNALTSPDPPVGVPAPGTAGLVLIGLGTACLMGRNRKNVLTFLRL